MQNSVISQFMDNPRERHMQVVEKIHWYLKSSPIKGLLFKKEDTLTPKIHTNVDYACSITDIYLYIRYVHGRKSSHLEKEKNRIGYLVQARKLSFELWECMKDFG